MLYKGDKGGRGLRVLRVLKALKLPITPISPRRPRRPRRPRSPSPPTEATGTTESTGTTGATGRKTVDGKRLGLVAPQPEKRKVRRRCLFCVFLSECYPTFVSPKKTQSVRQMQGSVRMTLSPFWSWCYRTFISTTKKRKVRRKFCAKQEGESAVCLRK